MSGWLQLLAAIALEVAATSLLPATEGFTRPAVTVPALLLYGASFLLLARSLRTLPLSVAYAAWSG
ncbi:SMR family transporter, partial [Georgenia sp. 10Sc9-8]|nr:SMR family transporter [Georgenia halotolerans]